jgi:hypothetical protein
MNHWYLWEIKERPNRVFQNTLDDPSRKSKAEGPSVMMGAISNDARNIF